MRQRLNAWDIGFLILMMLGIAAAVYHASSGRYANALMAAGAALLGTVVLLTDQTARRSPAPARPPRPRALPYNRLVVFGAKLIDQT